MRKRVLALTLVIVMLVFAAPAQANAQGLNGTLFLVGSEEYISGKYVYPMDVAPFVENGRTYLPIRYLADALNIAEANIVWDASTETVRLTKEGYGTIYLSVGDTVMRSNINPSISMDVVPVNRNNRVFLPARYIAEAFGETVSWAPETNGVLISQSDGQWDNTPVTPAFPAEEDDTPIPPYEWTYGGNQWSWDSGVTQRAVGIILDHYREMPHPHRTQLDYVLTYCTDEDSLYMIDALAKEITEIATREGIPRDEIPYLAIAFVQSFPYVSDSISSGYDEYPRYPIETFFERKGDCEDTAILTAVLLKQLGYGSALVILPSHCAVGVLGKDTIEGTYYLIDGKRYYYLETTDVGWKVGELPDSIKETKAIVLPLP